MMYKLLFLFFISLADLFSAYAFSVSNLNKFEEIKDFELFENQQFRGTLYKKIYRNVIFNGSTYINFFSAFNNTSYTNYTFNNKNPNTELEIFNRNERILKEKKSFFKKDTPYLLKFYTSRKYGYFVKSEKKEYIYKNGIQLYFIFNSPFSLLCPINKEKPNERQIFSVELEKCVGDCTDKCSNKWGFEDGTCIDCSASKTREAAANCFCSSQGLGNPNHSVVFTGVDGNSTYYHYTKCGETPISFKVYEPGCKNSSDNSDNNGTNPPDGGGGSGDQNNTNPNPPGGGGIGGGGGGGGDENSTDPKPNPPDGGGGSGDQNNTNPNPPGGGGSDPNPKPNPPDGGGGDENSTDPNPNPPGGGGGGSGEQNGTNIHIDREANKIGGDLSKKIDDMSKSFLDERGIYQQKFDDFKSKIESNIETIKKGFKPLKKSKVTTCNLNQSFSFSGQNVNFNIDICKQLSVFYNVFYFLSFLTFMFFGLKFLIHIVFIFMSGV